MAGTTPTYGLRYAELVDPPDGAALGKNLADDVEAELERIDTAAADLDSRVGELEGAWSDYGGTVGGVTVGDATLTTRSQESNGTVRVRASITGGSTSSGGVSQVTFSLPAPAHADGEQALTFSAQHGGPRFTGVAVIAAGSSTAVAYYVTSDGTLGSWTAFDDGTVLAVSGDYERGVS